MKLLWVPGGCFVLGDLITPLLAGKTTLGGSSSTKLPIRRSAGRKRGGQKDSLCEQTRQQGLKEVLEATTRGKTALKAAKIFLVQGDSNTSVLGELRERRAGNKSFFLLFPATHYSLQTLTF